MSSEFPSSQPDWCNIDVVRRNTLTPRSYFYLYENEGDAIASNTEKSSSLKLSGKWKFDHATSPFNAPVGFEQSDYDTTSWADIEVPGIWQLQGWGKPLYTNVNYPFFVDPPHVPYEDNQTGSYVRKFTLPTSFADKKLILRFEGVDSAYHVYLNGKELGYSQGSRNASEFDITSVANAAGENTLAVRVYQYCDGSYLEDQDQWRFSGIFRDVYIHAFPTVCIKDFHVQTILDDKYQDAELKVIVETEGQGSLDVKLVDKDGQTVVSESTQNLSPSTTFTLKVAAPLKWTAETPSLYKLVLSLNNHYIAQNVGFRRIEIKDGIYLINGQRIVFRGANRHEHHPEHGRAVPYEFMKQDLLIMKRHNINAIRTCHQPSDPRLYSLADELGFYVMDEADVECHGFASIDAIALPPEFQNKSFEEKKEAVYGSAARWTSDNPQWRDHYVDRALQLVSRDKNHPSVVMWSLGNEAFYGCNFQEMYDTIKSIDQSRPIHYEGDSAAKTADLFSQMYPSVSSIIEFAQEKDFTKPLVLCEFVHAMGNGPGNIKEYVDAFYNYPRLQGGWVWEWADHGLKTKNEHGVEYYAYGGDFGDHPNDGNFVMDGVLFSDHTPTPGLVEYKKAIEPVQVQIDEERNVTVTNRFDTKSLDELRCDAWLVGDGFKETLGQVRIPENIKPHSTGQLQLPHIDLNTVSTRGETFLLLEFRLKIGTLWADANHLIASSQVPYGGKAANTLLSSSAAPKVTATPASLKITASSSTYTLSLATGHLTSWLKSVDNQENELLPTGIGPHFTTYRAQTDNDRPQDGRSWTKSFLHLARNHLRSVDWSTDADNGAVVVKARHKHAAPVLSWSIDTTTEYTFHSNGVRIKVTGEPRGLNLPLTLPRLGLELTIPASLSQVSWFGRGPGESYRDSKLSQHIGNYSANVDELWMEYAFPQECGNRTDIRHVTFSSKDSQGPATLKASFGAQEGFSFQASHYSTKDVDGARHPFELRGKKQEEVLVRFDAQHHGLGTGSCGPKTLDEYALKTGTFEFEVLLE